MASDPRCMALRHPTDTVSKIVPKTSLIEDENLLTLSKKYSTTNPCAPRKKAPIRNAGKEVHISLLPWGVWGPDALSWFLKDTGEIKHSKPGHVIYPVPFAITGVTLNPNRAQKARNLIKEDTLSIHFWGRRFRNIAAKYDGEPAEGSYVTELCKRHKIHPEKTAHMMLKPYIIDPIKDVDFSMFDDADVANLVMQRSEVGNVDQEIRDWLDDNDAPLQKYAQENRDAILNKALEVARRECEFFVEPTDDPKPKKIADIGCGYAFADLFLYHRYKSDIVLIDIEESNDRHFGFADSRLGNSQP